MKHFSPTPITHILFSLLLLLLLTSPSASEKVPPYIRRDLSGEQWKYFKRQTNNYYGLWVRINSTGDVFASSKVKRTFEKIPGGRNGHAAYLQTVIYNNVSYSYSGMKKRQYVYTKTDPPTWGQNLFPNGTLSTAPLQGSIAFFPHAFGYWINGNPTAPGSLHATEVYAVHPWNPNARFTSVVLYAAGAFSFANLAREVGNVTKFPSAPWKGGTVVDVLKSARARRGPWSEVTHCLREPGLIYERYVRTVRDDLPGVPTGADWLTFRARDGPIILSFPKTFVPVAGQRDVSMYFEWQLSSRDFLRVVATVAPDGSARRTCGSLFHRMSGLE